jgi:hypothetical protein
MKTHLMMLRYFIHDAQNPKKFIKPSKQMEKFKEGETNEHYNLWSRAGIGLGVSQASTGRTRKK